MLGMRGSNTSELVFEDVEVPFKNVLGEEGRGVRVLMSGLDYERGVLSGIGLGIAAACLDEITPYLVERKQFGQSVRNFQLIADIYTKMNTTRAYVYEVACACDRGRVLGLFFATTVLIVFAAGFLAPRLAHRWGQHTIGMIGLFIALAGSLSLFAFAAAPAFMPFTMAIALYLLGMGLINPLGTAIALHPFGAQAGLASALLGFLQMGCAAIGASLASVLPLQPSASLAVILTTGSALALLVFLPIALRRPKAKLGRSGDVPESIGG
jgi:alkylation response protein AidB-like acyl-CoA dehydrogenase